MEISKSCSRPSIRAPQDRFTGAVRQDPLFPPRAPSHTSGAIVTFEPGARTHWHSHPLGQALIVLTGCGRVQAEGGPVREITPGDVVWFAPDEKHWHGAAPQTAMSHISIAEQAPGKGSVWMEPVTDEQYAAPAE